MKKLFLIVAVIISMSYSAVASNGSITLIKLDDGLYCRASGISADGKYICGYAGVGIYSFTWTKANGVNPFDKNIVCFKDDKGIYRGVGSQVLGISNNGWVCGTFPDSTYSYWDYEYNDDIGDYEDVWTTPRSAGYWDGTKWNSLHGLYPTQNHPDSSYLSLAEAISADGKFISGTSPWSRNMTQAATIWENGVARNLPFATPIPVGDGGRAYSVSDDGKIAVGWVTTNYEWRPAIWKNNTLHILDYYGVNGLKGDITRISHNGKYALLNIGGDATIYDVENDKLTIIGIGSPRYISDNGMIVVGYSQREGVKNYGGISTFIWKEDIGYMWLDEYLTALGIEVPPNYEFINPYGISADGSKIVGAGYQTDNYEENGWYIEIDNHLTKFNPAKYLTGQEEALGKIKLNWEQPTPDANNTLIGYNVYRNNTKITANPVTATTYTDENLGNGNYNYNVVAVYNAGESIPTRNVKINTGLLTVPFLDEFNERGFDYGYWNTVPKTNSMNLLIADYYGIPAPSILFLGNYGKYNEAVTSGHIEVPKDIENLYFSYNISVPSDWENISTNDSFKVELFDGSQWHTIASYIPQKDGGFSSYIEHNISNYKNADIIRIRFRIVGENNDFGTLIYGIDNVNVFTSKLELLPPRNVSAHYSDQVSGRMQAYINWSAPNDITLLSYIGAEGGIVEWIGNEGKSFIAANYYSKEDLEKFDNFKLTEISAYLRRSEENVNTPATYKLVVFKDNQKVLDRPIAPSEYTMNAWNTFKLSEPITVEASKSLYYGIEVVTHEAADRPLACSEGDYIITEESGELVIFNVNAGKSNLYSEDNGVTWKKLSDTSIIGDAFGLKNSWAITGIIKKDVNSELNNHDVLGYVVYRNGERIMDLQYEETGLYTHLHNFTDFYPLERSGFATGEVCYTVSAYYRTEEHSAETAANCIPLNSIDGEETEDTIIVYPNSTNGIINILGDFKSLQVYDMNGVILHNATSNSIDITSYPTGVYFLKIHRLDGSTVSKKIIKE